MPQKQNKLTGRDTHNPPVVEKTIVIFVHPDVHRSLERQQLIIKTTVRQVRIKPTGYREKPGRPLKIRKIWASLMKF